MEARFKGGDMCILNETFMLSLTEKQQNSIKKIIASMKKINEKIKRSISIEDHLGSLSLGRDSICWRELNRSLCLKHDCNLEP